MQQTCFRYHRYSNAFAYVGLSRMRHRSDIVLTKAFETNTSLLQQKTRTMCQQEWGRLDTVETIQNSSTNILIAEMQTLASSYNEHKQLARRDHPRSRWSARNANPRRSRIFNVAVASSARDSIPTDSTCSPRAPMGSLHVRIQEEVRPAGWVIIVFTGAVWHQ